MPQPPQYERTIDFTERDGDDTDHPGLNQELDAAALSISALRINLALIQRDDGQLQNGIVGAEQLAPDAFEAVRADLNTAVTEAEQSAQSALTSALTAQGAVASAQQSATLAEQARASSQLNAQLAAQSAQEAATAGATAGAAAAQPFAAAAQQAADDAADSAAAAATFDPASYVPRAGNVAMIGPLSVPAGASGAQAPQAQEVAMLASTQLAGHRNKLINPFTENQRAATSVADDTYCLDRWYVLTESGNVTVAQVTDPESGAPSGIRLTQPDATAKRIGLAQIIESCNIRQHAGQAMNLFARVKLSAGTAIRYAVLEHAGTVDVVTSDVVNNWASTNFTTGNFFIAGLNVVKTGTVTPGAATWGQINDWSALGASVKNVVIFFWTESPLAQNGTLEINRPQYEPGVVATPHEWRLNELTLCQRYYWKGLPCGALNWGSSGASNPSWAISWPVPMRAVPAVTQDFTGATFTAGSAIDTTQFPTRFGTRLILSASANGYVIFAAGNFIAPSAEL